MAQGIDQADLDIKCARSRPWVRGFVEEHQDGRPWGYALFQDPTVDDGKIEECMCRLDLLLQTAQSAVFGRNPQEFPRFQWECLDWPEESEDEENRNGEDDNGNGGTSDASAPAAVTQSEHGIETAQQQSSCGMGDEEVAAEVDEDDAEIEEGSEDTGEDPEQDDDDKRDDNDNTSGEEGDDADIDLVKDLPRLRTYFHWVCHQKKRRKVHESSDVDRSGIPRGLLRNVFILIDEDAADSIVGNSSYADKSWVWAVDPNYTGDMSSMTKNGLKEEYYGYMRVRLQQLVNNFWVALDQDDLDLPTLWQAAKQSHGCAFVSVVPEEAQLVGGDMNLGGALRAYPVAHELGPPVVQGDLPE